MPVRKRRFSRNLTKGHPDQKMGKTAMNKTAIAEAAAARRSEGAQLNTDVRIAAHIPTLAEMRKELSRRMQDVISAERRLAQEKKQNVKQAAQIKRQKVTQKETATLLQ